MPTKKPQSRSKKKADTGQTYEELGRRGGRPRTPFRVSEPGDTTAFEHHLVDAIPGFPYRILMNARVSNSNQLKISVGVPWRLRQRLIEAAPMNPTSAIVGLADWALDRLEDDGQMLVIDTEILDVAHIPDDDFEKAGGKKEANDAVRKVSATLPNLSAGQRNRLIMELVQQWDQAVFSAQVDRRALVLVQDAFEDLAAASKEALRAAKRSLTPEQYEALAARINGPTVRAVVEDATRAAKSAEQQEGRKKSAKAIIERLVTSLRTAKDND
ncbi:MAG: hypothetical protein ACXIUZ_00655 [Lysobacteraceae bacterium]